MSSKKKGKLKSPLQYKKGFIRFLGCKINLSKKPFIPRIETEYWVGEAIRELRIKNRELRILDMFSGSGCIGVAVLKHIKNSYVDFTDNDRKWIEQIKINLKLNKVSPKRYKIYKSDLFRNLKNRAYNVIFANPPYVAENRINEVQKSVLEYEPKKALFSGKKGLNHIERFLKEAKRFLKQEGIIYLEFDPKQKKEIEKIL
jgi:release factor glutamine methyltransferase